jgi:DNA-binding beta-propeller fold protein YncE
MEDLPGPTGGQRKENVKEAVMTKPQATIGRTSRREVLKLAGFSALAAHLAPRVEAQTGGGAPSNFVFALRGDGKVAVIDSKSDELVRTIETGGRGGTLGCITADGARLFVANNAPGQRTVTVIDARTLAKAGDVETGNRPKHPVVSPDGQLLAVNHSGMDANRIRIAFMNPADARIVGTVDIPVANTGHSGDISMHGAWSPDGKVYAIGNYADNQIVLIDRDRMAIAATVPTTGNPHYFDWHRRELWVTVEANEPKTSNSRPQVVVVDASNAASPRAAAPLSLSRHDRESFNEAFIEGHHGNFTNDGERFIVVNRGSGAALEGVTLEVYSRADRKKLTTIAAPARGLGHAYLSPDGRYALITQYNDSVVPVLDLSSLKLVATINAGGGGHMGHVAFTPDSAKAYINNRKADEVVVVDMRSFAITRRIRTAPSGEAQAMVLNRPYGVFERVVNPYLA